MIRNRISLSSKKREQTGEIFLTQFSYGLSINYFTEPYITKLREKKTTDKPGITPDADTGNDIKSPGRREALKNLAVLPVYETLMLAEKTGINTISIGLDGKRYSDQVIQNV